MTNRERVAAVLSRKPVDRLPMVEWATWWHLTTDRWMGEGAPAITGPDTLQEYFGLDPLRQIWISPRGSQCPAPVHHGAGILGSEAEYHTMLPHLYPEENLTAVVQTARDWAEGHQRGDYATWLTLEGFFWFPRTLFGIEAHLYAFYDEPELMHRMNQDLVDFHLRCLEQILPVFQPEFMTFAEDMSYNHGPMVSKALFDEFMLPYYQQVIPVLKAHGRSSDPAGRFGGAVPYLCEATG